MNEPYTIETDTRYIAEAKTLAGVVRAARYLHQEGGYDPLDIHAPTGAKLGTVTQDGCFHTDDRIRPYRGR